VKNDDCFRLGMWRMLQLLHFIVFNILFGCYHCIYGFITDSYVHTVSWPEFLQSGTKKNWLRRADFGGHAVDYFREGLRRAKSGSRVAWYSSTYDFTPPLATYRTWRGCFSTATSWQPVASHLATSRQVVATWLPSSCQRLATGRRRLATGCQRKTQEQKEPSVSAVGASFY